MVNKFYQHRANPPLSHLEQPYLEPTMRLAPDGNRKHIGVNAPASSSKPCHSLPHRCRILPLLPPITRNVKLPIPATRLESGIREETTPDAKSKSGKNGNVDPASQLCRAELPPAFIPGASLPPSSLCPPRPLRPPRFNFFPLLLLLLRPLCPSVSSGVVLVSPSHAAPILVRAGPGPYNRRCGAMRAPPVTTASGSPIPPSLRSPPPAAPRVPRKSHAR